MFWNLENFFDWKDEGYSDSDREFSARGERHWTWKRYHAKCCAVAKSILWISDRKGRVPDVITLAEIENRKVLADIVNSSLLRKLGYGIVHYDSPDVRGIDVALLYRKSMFRLARSVPIHIPGVATRDILLASLVDEKDDTVHFLVNHHPSKYGGASSSSRRELAVGRLKAVCDSLWAGGGRSIILTGDFNDTPENPLYSRLCEGPCGIVNLAAPLAAAGEGTIRFRGKWDLIDMFMVSGDLASRSKMEIVRIPFLMVWDNVFPGYKPLRTYSGPRYLGGVSDHCPVLLTLGDKKSSLK
ncbi:MAG: hypothetical protein IJ795_05475 [Bacteroidales bacterium]|nr:hypothetical protein [Bacteroidales bacterium]